MSKPHRAEAASHSSQGPKHLAWSWPCGESSGSAVEGPVTLGVGPPGCLFHPHTLLIRLASNAPPVLGASEVSFHPKGRQACCNPGGKPGVDAANRILPGRSLFFAPALGLPLCRKTENPAPGCPAGSTGAGVQMGPASGQSGRSAPHIGYVFNISSFTPRPKISG